MTEIDGNALENINSIMKDNDLCCVEKESLKSVCNLLRIRKTENKRENDTNKRGLCR